MFKPGPQASAAEVALSNILPPTAELEHLLERMRITRSGGHSTIDAAHRAQMTFEALRELFGRMAGKDGATDSAHFLEVVLPALIEASRNGPREEMRQWEEEHDDARKVY